MRLIRSSARAAAIAIAAIAVSPLVAQDFSSYATAIGTSTSQSHAMGDVFRDVYTKGQGHGSSRGAYGTRGAAPVRGGMTAGPIGAMGGSGMSAPAALTRLQYRPTPATMKTALDAYVARARQSNPRDADTAYRELSQHDISQVYRGIVGPFGLGDGNVADSFTALTVLGWMVANGTGDPSPAMVKAARAQFAPALAANPVIGRDPVAAGEEYKLTFVILYSSWQSARRQGGMQQFADGVTRMFQQRGMDLRGIDLTPGGFLPRRG